MPFRSQAQRSKCWFMKSKNKNSSWDCEKWEKETGKKKLPKRVKRHK